MSVYAAYEYQVRSQLGELINYDPKNERPDIGRIIFKYLDIYTAVSFSSISKELYARSQKQFFTFMAKEIVLAYIKQGTSYGHYLKSGGWQDLALFGAKAATVAFGVVATAESIDHFSHAPPDALDYYLCPPNHPHNTDPELIRAEEKAHISLITHPEIELGQEWGLAATISDIAAIALIITHIETVISKSSLESFFSASESEIMGAESRNTALHILTPEYHKWKQGVMRSNLVSNPPNWKQNPDLSMMICPLSNDFMLFPVKDNCPRPHYFDYRSLRAFQLDQKNLTPSQCPLNVKKPNKGLAMIKFDKAKFDSIQRIIRSQASTNLAKT